MYVNNKYKIYLNKTLNYNNHYIIQLKAKNLMQNIK